MRKELLLEKKKEVIEKFSNLSYYERTAFELNEETLKQFSVKQLELLVDIINNANDRRDKNQQFYTLSVNECIHYDTGKIIFVDRDEVSEMTEEEIAKSASRNTYKKYKKIREDRKEEERKERERFREKGNI